MTEQMFVDIACGIMGVFGLVCLIGLIIGIILDTKYNDYWN